MVVGAKPEQAAEGRRNTAVDQPGSQKTGWGIPLVRDKSWRRERVCSVDTTEAAGWN